MRNLVVAACVERYQHRVAVAPVVGVGFAVPTRFIQPRACTGHAKSATPLVLIPASVREAAAAMQLLIVQRAQ